jgi:hypothetical protein
MNMKKSYYFRGQEQKKINTKFTLIQEVMRYISNLLTKNVFMMDKRAKKKDNIHGYFKNNKSSSQSLNITSYYVSTR